MKKIHYITLICLTSLILPACATRKSTPIEARRSAFKVCVSEFLREDVGPMASLKICQVVFKKPKDIKVKAQTGRVLF